MILGDCGWVLGTQDLWLTLLEHSLCARCCSLHFTCMSLLHPHKNPWRELPVVFLFMDEEAEAQRGPVPGPRPHSWGARVLRHLMESDSSICIPNLCCVLMHTRAERRLEEVN